MSIPCSPCYSGTPLVFDVQSFINNSCVDCQQQNCLPVKYLCYTGPNLTCSGIVTGDTLESALQKIDTQICSALGNYSTYQFNCLTAWAGHSITTEATFINDITAYVCELRGFITTLNSTTIPNLDESVTSRLDDISAPNITCASAGVISSDDLNTVLTKYCTKFSTIDTALSLSGVVWNSCITTSTPTTIAQAFSAVENQICTVFALANAAAVLPIFDNTSSCLASPGATDTLVSTINKIKTRLCLTGTYDASTITWGCLPTGTTLQNSIQNIATRISDKQKLLITAVSADFVLTQTDAMDVCAGKTLSLAVPLVNNDRLVASNVGDTSPGTLIQKLTAGTNMSLDATTTPGQVILNATNDHLLLAGAGDPSANYLVNKVLGSSASGITLDTSYNSTSHQVDFTLSTDLDYLAQVLMTTILGSPERLAQFCNLVTECSGGCDSTLYSVNNTSGSTQNIFWLSCGNGEYLNLSLPTATTISLCAITDSIIPITGVTVTALSSPCPTVTPATTTTTTIAV